MTNISLLPLYGHSDAAYRTLSPDATSNPGLPNTSSGRCVPMLSGHLTKAFRDVPPWGVAVIGTFAQATAVVQDPVRPTAGSWIRSGDRLLVSNFRLSGRTRLAPEFRGESSGGIGAGIQGGQCGGDQPTRTPLAAARMASGTGSDFGARSGCPKPPARIRQPNATYSRRFRGGEWAAHQAGPLTRLAVGVTGPAARHRPRPGIRFQPSP